MNKWLRNNYMSSKSSFTSMTWRFHLSFLGNIDEIPHLFDLNVRTTSIEFVILSAFVSLLKSLVSTCIITWSGFIRNVGLTHFQPMFHFCTTLKTSENRRFSDVSRECRSGTLAENGLMFGNLFIESVGIKLCKCLRNLAIILSNKRVNLDEMRSRRNY